MDPGLFDQFVDMLVRYLWILYGVFCLVVLYHFDEIDSFIKQLSGG